MFKRIWTLVTTLLLLSNLSAQIHRSLHKTYALEDSITSINIDIFEHDEQEVVQWAGNTIMTETQVQLFGASEGVLNHYIDTGRYEIELVVEEKDLKIISKDMVRRPIKTTSGDCSELVKIRFYVPEEFEKVDDDLWRKKEEEEEEE